MHRQPNIDHKYRVPNALAPNWKTWVYYHGVVENLMLYYISLKAQLMFHAKENQKNLRQTLTTNT